LVILGLPIMMAAMRLVLSLVAVVGGAGSRGSSGCEACVGLSARGCLDALGASLAALGDGSRVMVLETVLAGSDRCDGADLATCAARYDELVASLARPARLRRLRAACGGGRAAAAAAGAAAPDAFGAGGDGAAAAGPPWGVASLGGWSLGSAGRETATCAACDGAATRDGCVRAALAAHLDDAAGLAAVVDARVLGTPDDSDDDAARAALLAALWDGGVDGAARYAAVVAACAAVEARGRDAFLGDGRGAAYAEERRTGSCGACGDGDDAACAARLREALRAADDDDRLAVYEVAFAGGDDWCAGGNDAATCADRRPSRHVRDQKIIAVRRRRPARGRPLRRPGRRRARGRARARVRGGAPRVGRVLGRAAPRAQGRRRRGQRPHDDDDDDGEDEEAGLRRRLRRRADGGRGRRRRGPRVAEPRRLREPPLQAQAHVADCVEINHWFGGSPPNFRTLYLNQIEVDSADFWTDRLLSSSSRSTAKESGPNRSITLTLKSG